MSFRQIQRDRIMRAVAEIVERLGLHAPTVSEIVAYAGVSRRTFYEHFADREEALAATVEESLARAAARVVPAYRGQADWCNAIRAGLAGLLAFLDEEPAFGNLLLLDAFGGPFDQGRARSPLPRARAIEALIDAVDGGRVLARSPAGLSRATAEGALGGVLFILRSRTLERRGHAMGELSELMAMIVRPYLGGAAAAREARRQLPTSKSDIEQDGNQALVKVDVRLTMRTILVLRQIAEHPGSSNRQIAALAEIDDQGQASKLLARLAGAGLIENASRNLAATGTPNAWRLRPDGKRLVRALSSASRRPI